MAPEKPGKSGKPARKPAGQQPPPEEPVPSEPVRTKPVRNEPVRNGPARREPVRTKPARKEPSSPAGAFTYAPAPESRAIVDLAPSYGLFIDGECAEAADGRVFKTVSPASEEVLAEVARAGERDVDRAVRAARRAFAGWSALPGAERGKYLFRIARILQERSRELAVLETLDNGKPIRETRDVDLPLVAAHFFYYAGWADKLEYAGFGPAPRPLGVAGQVIPWNFPLLMLAWKIAPALAAGNTVVLKPAETTPLSALFFADVCRQAGLPRGVVNILPGYGDAGAALVAHEDVDKVAFTGSTEVGRAIARTVAGTRKKVTLELGGKAANIVFDDAPLDQAVEGIVNGIFFNQGHVCCAGSRLLVQESVHDEVLDALKRRMSTLRVGDPLDKNTDIGAINSAGQLARITALAEAGEAEGAERWAPACELPSSGYWFAPTLFTGVTQAHRIAREEIFGPVLSVLTFRTPAEAVEKANNTPYGLSAGIWTEKGSRILSMASRLRAGVVWANTFNKFDPTSPFGGYKESGYGREGGRHGLEAYLAAADGIAEAAGAPGTARERAGAGDEGV
jgi:aldehyde dehydrogenase (NAD+)